MGRGVALQMCVREHYRVGSAVNRGFDAITPKSPTQAEMSEMAIFRQSPITSIVKKDTRKAGWGLLGKCAMAAQLFLPSLHISDPSAVASRRDLASTQQ